MNDSKISDKKLLSQHTSEEKDTDKEAGEEELKKLKELLQQRDNEISILCEEKCDIWVWADLATMVLVCVRQALAVWKEILSSDSSMLKQLLNSQLLCGRTPALHLLLFQLWPKPKSWIQAPLSFRTVQPRSKYCGSGHA